MSASSPHERFESLGPNYIERRVPGRRTREGENGYRRERISSQASWQQFFLIGTLEGPGSNRRRVFIAGSLDLKTYEVICAALSVSSIQHWENVSARRFCISLFWGNNWSADGENSMPCAAAFHRCHTKLIKSPCLAKMHTFFSSAIRADYSRV
jgi:hypothetical protein